MRKILCVVLSVLLLVAACSNPAASNKTKTAKEPFIAAAEPLFNNPLGLPEFDYFDESTWGSYLLASLPDVGIYIYEESGATIDDFIITIYHNGHITKINIYSGVFTRGNPPQILYYDFDNCGTNELAMIVQIGSGTGLSMSYLHMLTQDLSGNWALSSSLTSDWDELTGWFNPPMSYKAAEDEDAFYFYFNGEEFIFDTTNYKENGKFDKMDYGYWVNFEFEGTQIKSYIAISAMYDNFPIYGIHPVGTITANVIWDGKNLSLVNYQFICDCTP